MYLIFYAESPKDKWNDISGAPAERSNIEGRIYFSQLETKSIWLVAFHYDIYKDNFA